jgi:hypothetical protein
MPPDSPHAAEPANNPELRQIRENRAEIVDGTAPADLTVTGLAKALPYS